jgi:hypothetical protein
MLSLEYQRMDEIQKNYNVLLCEPVRFYGIVTELKKIALINEDIAKHLFAKIGYGKKYSIFYRFYEMNCMVKNSCIT